MCQLFLMALFETHFEPVAEADRRLYWRKVSEKEKRPADLCIVLRATLAFSNVSLHANQLDTWKRIVYEGKVPITKLATIHGLRLRVRKQVPG